MVFRQQTAHESDPLEKGGGRAVWKSRCELYDCPNLMPKESFQATVLGGKPKECSLFLLS